MNDEIDVCIACSQFYDKVISICHVIVCSPNFVKGFHLWLSYLGIQCLFFSVSKQSTRWTNQNIVKSVTESDFDAIS
jgi:hypothetical protein